MKKAIGILGGMGPEASVYMFKMLIDLAIRDFGAKNNDEFPEIILHSIPVPDFISSDKNKKKALHMLQKRLLEFNKLPISSIGIACNTVHTLLSSLESVSKVPFVSMIEEVVQEVQKDKKIKVGIIGTPSTLRYGLYQNELQKYNIQFIIPTALEMSVLERIIRNVIRGKNSIKDARDLVRIADALKKKGAEGIILGCTELPLVFPEKYSLSVYNSVEILVIALLRRYYRIRV